MARGSPIGAFRKRLEFSCANAAPPSRKRGQSPHLANAALPRLPRTFQIKLLEASVMAAAATKGVGMGSTSFARRIVAIFALFWLAACAHGQRPGETFRDCPECPEMVVVPAGGFVLGASFEGLASWARKRITIADDFAVGRFEVTVEQYEAFTRATGRPATENCINAIDRNLPWRFAQGGDHPVVCVSWEDTQAYVQWLNTITPGGYRLLSFTEWEYAARGGTISPYPWGETLSHGHANYGADECCSGLASGRDQWVHTAPAGSFGANAFGLSDMIGNVWEWTQECGIDEYGVRLDGSAFDYPECRERWSRGGGWESAPGNQLTFHFGVRREPVGPFASVASNVGFRVARTLHPRPPVARCYTRDGEAWHEATDFQDAARCFAQDTCTGLGPPGRCYKWALGVDAPAIPWAELGFRVIREEPACYRQVGADGQGGWTFEYGREAQCFQQDYCSGGLAQGSDFHRPCFKWALGPMEPALPWSASLTNPTPAEDIPPPQGIHENSFEQTSESCFEDCDYSALVPAGTMIYERPDPSSPLVGTLSAAECAVLVGFTSLSAPHRGVVLETHNEFTAGDVIYELAYAGEGNIHVWRRGEEFEVSGHDVVIRWDPEPETIDPRVGNWFELTRSNGTRGWAKDLDREAC